MRRAASTNRRTDSSQAAKPQRGINHPGSELTMAENERRPKWHQAHESNDTGAIQFVGSLNGEVVLKWATPLKTS